MRITQLNIYPVKSLQGVALEAAALTPRGLAFDRHWMVVDDDLRFVTQRELPAMARVTVRLTEQALVLEHPGAAPLEVPLAGDVRPRLTVRVWKDVCQALDEGEAAAGWLTEVLGRYRGGGLRLVRFPGDHRREVETDHLQVGERPHTAFPDGYPFLVASEASLSALNDRLAAKGLEAVPMSRFRPNLVVDGAEPFAEVDWDALSGETGLRLGLRKPCKRCKIITQDQRTGDAPVPREPLRTLVEMDTQPGWRGAYFGQNAILLDGEGATLAVGDRLTATNR
ncbi:MOSC N-terminal beta barrel domain-containing protein [Halomonas organivorans]